MEPEICCGSPQRNCLSELGGGEGGDMETGEKQRDRQEENIGFRDRGIRVGFHSALGFLFLAACWLSSPV